MIVLIAMAIPFLSTAQAKNVLSTNRVFPKVDKVLEFEKALAAHAQKYHKGDVTWHVFEIQSGPDAGGYQLTEGPNSWDGLDKRGDLGEEHKNDWNKNVCIHLTEKKSKSFAVYQDSLSTDPLNNFSDKVNITHVYPKIGTGNKVEEQLIKKLRKVWQAEGITVAVFTSSSSGKPQYTIATRYKQGLKEKEKGFRRPFKEAFEAAHGTGSYDQYQKDLSDLIEDRWEELLFLRKDLGTK